MELTLHNYVKRDKIYKDVYRYINLSNKVVTLTKPNNYFLGGN